MPLSTPSMGGRAMPIANIRGVHINYHSILKFF
jgi:hypothetical protein